MATNDRFSDPLDELLAIHDKANGVTSSSTEVTEVNDNNTNNDVVDDIYGDNDLSNDIANEEENDRIEREKLIEAARAADAERAANKVIMPPDEKDMKYHDDAISYQGDKLDTVTGMVNRVVAKYRLISGGIPDVSDLTNNIKGSMEVMGELIDIYHKTGADKITQEFENTVLSNWIMPNGTRAIDNINSQGFVVDVTLTGNGGNNNNTSSNEDTNDDEVKPIKEETPTININVEKNTPVTVNVDDSITSMLTKKNELNIYVKEVSNEDLLKTVIVENSDKEGVITPYDSGINDVPITLPLSGYRCVMRGVNWYDFIKLTAPTSQNSTDNELKKWSVIYDHIKNPSIGNFEDFEDFLKKTKYQDRELLMWGLLVATADDEEVLSIRCGNPKCGKPIRIVYQPRTISHIDPDKIPAWYKAAHEAAPGADAIKVWEQAANKRTRYLLPETGIIAEINEPSAYDFVTIKLPLVNELLERCVPGGDMSKIDPSDPKMVEFDYLSANAMFVSAMTIVREENGKPKEYRYTNWSSIEQIITTALGAQDSGILLKIIEKTRTNVSPVSFRVNDINCESCGKHEDYIPITDIGQTLLFQVSRRLSSTEINLIEMQ